MQDHEGLFIISVAARLLEMHQQTLRKYERAGFVIPQRTAGKLRLYSVEDVERLRQIKYLVDEMGMNLDGVQVILEVSQRLERTARLLENAPTAADLDRVRGDVAEVVRLLGGSTSRHASS